MTNGFVNTVKSKTESLPIRAYFKNEDIGQALHASDYSSARGWLTNKQGRQIEITLDNNTEFEKILSEGLDFHNLHLHVEFEELESSRITITAGNVPVEAGDMNITEVIEAHGGKIERVAYVTQEYRGNQVQTGRRRYHITKTKAFQPLPKVVRLFGGRYISFRHPGQPVTDDVWEVNETPASRNHRSYASVTQQPSSETEPTAIQDNVGENYQQTSPENHAIPPAQPPVPAQPPQQTLPTGPAPPTELAPTPQAALPSKPSPAAHPPQPSQPSQPPQPLESSAPLLQPTTDSIHQYLEFTDEAAMDWEETTTTPLPTHIERFTISYFEWLQEHVRLRDPRKHNQYINIWHSCINKVHHINSAPHDQIPPLSTTQTDQPIPATRMSINARSLQILQECMPEVVQSAEMEVPENAIVTDPPPHDQTTLMENTQQPATEIATTQQTDSWGESESKVDMEWDGGALVGPRNRPLEAITVIDSDDSEGQPDSIYQQEEGEIPEDDTLVSNQTTSPPEPEMEELGQQELNTTELTAQDLLPDYQNQASTSQSVASEPVTTHGKSKKKKKRVKPGTDSEAGAVPPGAKKPNKPDGFHVKVGNFEKRISNNEARKLKDKIRSKTVLTHEDILIDMLLNHGRLNNMLNHQNTTNESRAKMFAYYGYLYYRHIGPMSTEWSNNPYIDHTPDGVLNTWDEFTTQNVKYNARLYEDYLPMLNLSRRSGNS